MTRLCFGTFAQILRLCKLGNVTDPQLIGTMTRTVDPECGYINPDNATQVSRLLSCTGNLSTGHMTGRGSGAVKKPGESISNVVQAAQKANKADVVQKFEDTVICLIDEDKKEQAVLALLEIIKKDTILDDNSSKGKKKSFEKYTGTTKNALLSQSEVVLADLLAGIFLYTAAAGVTNSVGKETVKGLTPDYLNGLTNTRGIKIVNHLSLVMDNLPENIAITADACLVATASGNTLDQQVNELDTIMQKIVETLGKNATRKTSQEEWQEFYIALQETVRLGRGQNDASGELKTFINNIAGLYKDWEEILNTEKPPVDNVAEVFGKIVKETDAYLFCRDVLEVTSEPKPSKTKPDFATYLQKAKEKYNTIKTLLYSDQPKPFYDFYVCNDIFRRVAIPGKSNKYQYIHISNATIKLLAEVSRFIIIAGAGGLGKSMMMRHLLLNAIENFKDIKLVPVFIPLKDFDESANGLLDYVFLKFDSLCGDVDKEGFEAALANGSCILLFDGLDEIGMSHAERFERELETFTDKYPDNIFVISSRPYQTFISYSRFSVLQLQPFSKQQALTLIDKLEFRPDDPSIKEKFSAELDSTLYWTHRAFIENPLLLTIMLMTFERFAEVPSKMHIFYREAFLALSVTHDASKGAYKRALKTGLSVDIFADYFAEICFRSYREEKFEFTESEFEKYFNDLSINDKKTNHGAFLYDLCSNMCLMYSESGKYHFTHRSFQEYFCAVFFSKQKDKFISKLGDFFEKRRSRMYGDQTFNMLCDLIPEKVEEFIFIPYMEDLFRKCDEQDGYHTFLRELYPSFHYQKGEVPDSTYNPPKSFLYGYLLRSFSACGSEMFGVDDLPEHDDFLTDEYVYIENEDEEQELVNLEEVGSDYRREYGTPDTVGWRYEIDISDAFDDDEEYSEILEKIDNDEFIFKLEYKKARSYLESLKAKQKISDDTLLDLL